MNRVIHEGRFNTCALEIDDDAWSQFQNVERLMTEAYAATLEELRLSKSEAKDGDISVLLTSDAAITELNKIHRGKTGPTNVLSFPAHESASGWLGDIAIAHGVAMREAAESAIAPEDHVSHLLIHGFLHLHGYDHIDDEDAERMEAIERRALARLGIADPYAVGGRMNE